jgi:hypothetical protein
MVQTGGRGVFIDREYTNRDVVVNTVPVSGTASHCYYAETSTAEP